jgi:tRNA pseudouridine32 synthase/23S rRNA pseudouridine746 synthase
LGIEPVIKIIFENENIVVADKPGGWLSVPSQWGEEDPRPVLSLELPKQMGFSLLPVHRLDLDVTGIILFAKNTKAHQAANRWFESREITKIYEAWTEGETPADLGAGQMQEWSSTLHRGKKRSFESPHGKLAVTRAYWLETIERAPIEKCQRWLLEPLTGRPHQLRVHLSRHGFPILGDKLYGATKDFLPNIMALRAVRLDFSDCPEAAQYGLPKEIKASGLESLF